MVARSNMRQVQVSAVEGVRFDNLAGKCFESLSLCRGNRLWLQNFFVVLEKPWLSCGLLGALFPRSAVIYY